MVMKIKRKCCCCCCKGSIWLFRDLQGCIGVNRVVWGLAGLYKGSAGLYSGLQGCIEVYMAV